MINFHPNKPKPHQLNNLLTTSDSMAADLLIKFNVNNLLVL